MKLSLKRIALKDAYTIGRLHINGSYYCDTLEPPVRSKKPRAIPTGIYKIVVMRSPRFDRQLPRLLDVPDFIGILIHAGNTVKDTAGCILVGENKVVGGVINSRKAEKELTMRILRAQNLEQEVTIEIT